jgi:hypothetical protein
MTAMLRLYPAAWRRRYGAEFEALLAERPPSLGDRVDIVRGAMDARLRPQLPGEGRVRDRGGYLALLGLGAFVAALVVAANGPLRHDEFGTYREGVAALPIFALALVLLLVALYPVVRALPAGVARSLGSIGLVAGPIWSIMPWVMPVGLVFLVGLVAVADGARRAGLWSAWPLVGLLIAVAAPAVLFAATSFLPWYFLRQLSQELGPIFLLSLSGIWVVVGAAQLHGHARPSSVA